MTDSPRRHIYLPLVAALLAACPAAAQMVPLLDLRQMSVKAVYEGAPDEHFDQPPSPFASWDKYSIAFVPGPLAGSASAEAYQRSEFFPSGIFASGTTTGQFQVGTGTYDALSLSTMTFRVDTCITYFLDATVDPGDPQSQGEITVGVPIGAPNLMEVISGHVVLNGRLSPGQYFVEGRSSVSTFGQSMAGPSYGIIWTCQPCASTLIMLQPSDVVASSGSNASFSVTTSTTAAATTEQVSSLTYQWRRNRTPLTNNGHISGATTGSLSITNVTVADTGWYDVVVTSGSIVEPSAYARLTVGTTGVDPFEPPAPSRFTLEAAAPNPSSGATSFRFAVPQPAQASAAIYDAAGHMVRPLANRFLSGAGVLTWDGHSASGQVAPAGVYFLRVLVDGQAHVRRFVRMR